MADERFIDLSATDRTEVLEVARDRAGRPAHLLEKDVWVVWTLNALFSAPFASDLTFKGGTSLSKAYGVITRFSEDVDLTYDIRKLIPDLASGMEPLPTTSSQAKKWSKAVRARLPEWLEQAVKPHMQAALIQDQLDATLEIDGDGRDKLLLHYPPLNQGTGYIRPTVLLEFGARATGEPNTYRDVRCDMEGHVAGVAFPRATPRVMSIARTFWEKATAAHVYCAQKRIRSERYARHWYDLVALAQSEHFPAIIQDRAVAEAVARHKTWFFVEKDEANNIIDYHQTVEGGLCLVPDGVAQAALSSDYAKMVEDQVLLGDAPSFEELMKACATIEAEANALS